MAEPSVRPLITEESDSEALSLVSKDLQSSDKFKREFCPTEKVVRRRRAYEGDPEAYEFPYDSKWGARLINNWMLRQINHKVGKLSKPPVRLNLKQSRGDDSDEMRLMLTAIRKKLEEKGRQAKWRNGRRHMLMDASKVGFGVRCVGLVYDRTRYLIRTLRVRAEEFHMDPTAEGFDDAEWMSWRRYVVGSKLGDTLKRHPELSPAGAGSGLTIDSRPQEIALSDDRILIYGRNLGDKGTAYLGLDPYLLTDYYRKDQTQDFYYPCPGCGRYAGVSRFREEGQTVSLYKCAACKRETKKTPPRDVLRRLARYPNGRHIRIIGPGTVDYQGPNRAKLEDVFPFVGMAWYEGEVWPGISEVQQLAAPQIYNQVAMAMLSDNAFTGAHSKVIIPKDGIEGGWNNDGNQPIQVSQECWQMGGPKNLPPTDISSSARLLLERSLEDLFLLAANSPESQGQAPDTIRSGVGIARIVAASDVGLFLTNESLVEADARFYRIVRDYCRMIDSPSEVPMTAPDGTPGTYSYDRTLMTPDIEVEVLTERDVDQEREELFSRAVEMRGMQVREVDDQMLLELSGIPDDVIQRARERANAQAYRLDEAGMAPAISGSGPPTNGAPPTGGLPASIAARVAGAHAPKQTRPPSRSRGAVAPTAPFGGG